MGKATKQSNRSVIQKSEQKNIKDSAAGLKTRNEDFIWSMSMAPRLNEGYHWFQMLPAVFFTACVIMIVRLHSYTRPMSQFYWTSSGNDLVEFFSYYKMVALVLCAVFAIVILLYRIFAQSMFIKRTPYYIPMAVYSAFVLISYFASDYKEFALWGWNDRFEGTVTLLAYMVMLFFIINTVNSEVNVKHIVYALGITSAVLSLLGLSQSLDHDFFRTTIGKKLITPSSFWENLDSLTFTFNNKEIYQTVYNINYVSFYLTLLLPLFGLLFIHSVMKGKEESIWKKSTWGILFALLIYNLIGSQSSGGLLGMAVVVLVALIVLNKRIINWWKPVLILLAITVLIGGLTYERWVPEISNASRSVLGTTSQEIPETAEDTGSPIVNKGYIDYIVTEGNNIIISYEGNEIVFTTYPENPLEVSLADAAGNAINISENESSSSYSIADERFHAFNIESVQDSAGVHYLLITIDDSEWPFAIMSGKDVRFRNAVGNLIDLNKVSSLGWENNQDFGSGRGYIWSRTIPMLKNTLLLGHGADTYCIYFPQHDYTGKYNADWKLSLVIDKPHNLYFGAMIGTGGVSMIALTLIWFMYIIQSMRMFWRRECRSFLEYVGVGIFLGICGFLVSGLVNDSTVSVMPMFYGLLGTGIAINIMLKKQAIKS